ncbi:MAG: DUF3822 family protein [Tannerella sp.]|jgi:hypothetical protein|nr:DUF3822 family protein [Tannerella sp.]
MDICVPDTLTAQNSEKYILSIRFSPGGLSFAGYIPSFKDSFFCGEILIDHTQSYTKELEKIFIEYPFFLYTYRKVYFISADRQYTLVPEIVFLEKQKDELMSFVFSSPGEKVLHFLQKKLDIEVVYSVPAEVYIFFSHNLSVRPQFIHAITPLLSLCLKRNLSCFPKQLYVAMHEDVMDAVCLDKGTLLFANSFHYNGANDIIYYVLYIWKQTNMDQLKDELFLYAQPSLFKELNDALQNYLLNIETFDSVISSDKTEIPLDLKALFECEL